MWVLIIIVSHYHGLAINSAPGFKTEKSCMIAASVLPDKIYAERQLIIIKKCVKQY